MVRLMGERGYHSVSVDEIAAEAGVAKGTIYYHYSGKAALMEALMTDRLTPIIDAFEVHVLLATTDPKKALRAIIQEELTFFVEQRSFARLIVTELWREDREWRERLVAMRNRLVGAIEDVLRAGQKSGDFMPEYDAHFAASAIFGVVATSALDYLAFDRSASPEEVFDNVERMTFAALYVSPEKQ